MSDTDIPTFEEIFTKLSQVDLGKLTKKTPKGLTYLSWPHAYELLVTEFGAAFGFVFTEFPLPGGGYNTSVCYHTGGTGTVECTVGIHGHNRTCRLPIMTGFMNAAVVEPDARDINDAEMRCFVKCCSRFGLGLYIYQGEDLPREDEPTPKQKEQTELGKAALAAKNAFLERAWAIFKEAGVRDRDARYKFIEEACGVQGAESIEELTDETRPEALKYLEFHHPAKGDA